MLFVLFIWALEKNDEMRLNVPELAFMVYAFGFALEKVASMQEHGIGVYFTGIPELLRQYHISSFFSLGMWNGFDLVFGATKYLRSRHNMLG